MATAGAQVASQVAIDIYSLLPQAFRDTLSKLEAESLRCLDLRTRGGTYTYMYVEQFNELDKDGLSL